MTANNVNNGTPHYDLHEVSGRNISALLNPRPVVLIGAHHDNATDFATVAWITPLSHKPPMVAFALRSKSRTLQLVQAASCFSVNTVEANAQETVEYCGNATGHRENKAARIKHSLVRLEDIEKESRLPHEGLPFLVPHFTEALSILDCTVESIEEKGDHMLVCGKVRAAYTRCMIDSHDRVIADTTLLCLQHDVFATAKN